jgi:hypothetical protein
MVEGSDARALGGHRVNPTLATMPRRKIDQAAGLALIDSPGWAMARKT